MADALDWTRGAKAAGLAWSLGVSAFVLAFLLPTANPDLVANVALFCAVPLVACAGARFYYQGAAAEGAVLGLYMFAVAGTLDAVVTVPLLIMPAGGSYRSFYGDPGFWVIGLEYVGAVALYARFFKQEYIPV